MEESFFERMKRYVGFGDEDAANLRALGRELEPAFDAVIDEFYQRIAEDPVAAGILRDSGIGMPRFKRTLRRWMEDLFVGPYGTAHAERVARIGHTHVRVRLPQQYMVTAMNVVRTRLLEAAENARHVLPARAAVSLNRVLDLNLALMLDAYREDYAEQVREIERQRMEHHLEEVSHLANVGELAASLAHEIKNPLAGISGAIQVIATALEPDDPRREIISEILSQIDRLDRTARDLLIYAKPKPPARSPKNLSRVIQRTVKFLRQEPALGEIPIRCQGLERDVSARIDESQIEQVISNLVLNAAQACAENGDVGIHLSSDRDTVAIEIVDSGQGMTRDALKRAFEPFFTTKAKGTGLGLAICKRIVDAHEGRITIDSLEGKGTQVRITLPK
jgi:signal transduction histidine kinase